MRNRGSSSSSGMFLIELLLALMIFAIASAICLQVFVTSHQIAADSNTLNRAVIAAQNGAECFKASNGDFSEMAKLLGSSTAAGDSILTQHFDAMWKPAAPDSPSFAYTLEIKRFEAQYGLVMGEITVSGPDGSLIFSIPVSALEVT